MTVIGYADRFSVRPGETIRFLVSTREASYDASLVRFRGSLSPSRPIEPEAIPASFSGAHAGRHQAVPIGSYVRIDGLDSFGQGGVWTFTAWIQPGLVDSGKEQGIVSCSAAGGGNAVLLAVDEFGRLRFSVGVEQQANATTCDPLVAGRWYFVAATWDRTSGQASLHCTMERRAWLSPREVDTEMTGTGSLPDLDGRLVFGAVQLAPAGNERALPTGCFNGKLDRPSLWSRLLSDEEIRGVHSGIDPLSLPDGLAGCWDFSQELSSPRVIDRSLASRDGLCVNHPMRGVVGANWTGREVSPRLSSQEYSAIAFHHDDLTDCQWEVNFAFDVPADLLSGVYAARLEAGEAVDHIPFIVRRASGSGTVPVLFLAPTNTYLAYANERLYQGIESDPDFIEKSIQDPVSLTERDHFLTEHPELRSSVYDRHLDKTGICYSSRLRPVVTMRPESVSWTTAHPRHFSSDLHLIEWLEHSEIDYDVATDEDLHLEGTALLDEYAVVITGSHPEYWTEPMMDGLERYLSGGGRLMYLGGNGFYWVTGINPAEPHLIEVRRGLNGTRAWTSHPGEVHLSTTGELGGLWRNRGGFPNRLVGVGFAAQGWGGAPGYRRLPDSFDPNASFIFEGVGADEMIGEFGLIMGGAAGDEVDRYDIALGTPAEAYRLATTEGLHSDYYQLVIEDCAIMLPGRGGSEDSRVRSDLTYIEDSAGGAVFSVGSINWIGSLMWNGGDNNVSRITANVLNRFQHRERLAHEDYWFSP